MKSTFYIFFYIVIVIFVILKMKNKKGKLALAILLFPFIHVANSFEDQFNYLSNIAEPYSFLNDVGIIIVPLVFYLISKIGFLILNFNEFLEQPYILFENIPYSLFLSLLSILFLIAFIEIWRLNSFTEIKARAINVYSLIVLMITTIVFTRLDFYEIHPFYSMFAIIITWGCIFIFSIRLNFESLTEPKKILLYTYLILFSPNITTSQTKIKYESVSQSETFKFPIIKTQIDYLFNLTVSMIDRNHRKTPIFINPSSEVRYSYVKETEKVIISYGFFIFLLNLIIQSKQSSKNFSTDQSDTTINNSTTALLK